ncbi:ABC transporter permease [Demetria terragena]|uniref:ABC transporter permease n=1 Tax=Demetria terragena TaxID=63959 RepID=UPI0012E9BBE7|nr:ABC transporter permease [Demetria terragena]
MTKDAMDLRVRAARMWQDRKILDTLVRRDLRVRYARSALGYLWTLIDPLAMGFIYFFVFGLILNADRGTPMPFIVFLLAGLLPWNWFNTSVTETARALNAERKLVRSTNIPREFWVMRVVLAKGVEFLLSLPVLAFFIVLAMAGVPHISTGGSIGLNWYLLMVPVALVIQLMLCIGIGLIMAPLGSLADDFVRLVRILLRMMFYLSAILYPMSLVEEKAPEWAATLLSFNPMIGIIDMYRMGLANGQSPNLLAWGAAAVIAIFWLFFGLWVFRRLEPAVLKEI